MSCVHVIQFYLNFRPTLISLIPNFFSFYINDNDCARQKRFQVKIKLNNDSIIGCSFLLNYHCIESQFNINIFIFVHMPEHTESIIYNKI